jgi:hypothetical protein
MRPQSPAPVAPLGNGHGRPGRSPDDDPLTSPSFPAINTSDSRSYRTRRSNSQPGTSRPNGYPVQSPAAQSPASTTQASPRQSSAHAASDAPAANPYGSYVSAPQPAYQQPGYSEPAYPDAPSRGRTGPDYSGYPAAPPSATAGSGWYSSSPLDAGGPAGPSAADGYLSAASVAGTGSPTGRHAHNGSAQRGYTGIDYSNLRYDDPVYPDAQADGLAGYAAPGQPAAQHEQRAYSGPDLGYGQDGYQGYNGYGADRR